MTTRTDLDELLRLTRRAHRHTRDLYAAVQAAPEIGPTLARTYANATNELADALDVLDRLRWVDLADLAELPLDGGRP